MQQVCPLVTLQDPSLQNIEICFTLLRICHCKFEEDTLCLLGPWGVKYEMFFLIHALFCGVEGMEFGVKYSFLFMPYFLVKSLSLV